MGFEYIFKKKTCSKLDTGKFRQEGKEDQEEDSHFKVRKFIVNLTSNCSAKHQDAFFKVGNYDSLKGKDCVFLKVWSMGTATIPSIIQS